MRKITKIAGVASIGLLMVPGMVFGKTINQNSLKYLNMRGATMVAMGTVTSVNDLIITLNGKNGTIYTVDASKAKITKAKSAISTSNIQNGDNLTVFGQIADTNITATKIIDGVKIIHRTANKAKIHLKRGARPKTVK